jgi:hypothetical protein
MAAASLLGKELPYPPRMQSRLTLDGTPDCRMELKHRLGAFMDRGKTTHSRDIFSSPWLAFTLFCLPATAIAVAGRADFSGGPRTVVWSAALSTMGTACIVNAVRCGRLHCYITGPFFLAMAVVTLLYGLGVVPLGANGWNLIGITILAGAIALCFLPELLFWRYRKGRSKDGDHC